MTKPVLSLQNIPCETLGNLEGLIMNDGFDIEKVNTRRHRIPKDPTQFSAIVILGGPISVYENRDFINDQISLTQMARREKIPLLGICLGSQIIAQSTGGNVFKGPRKEVGWYKIMIETAGRKGLFSGLDSSGPTVFQWHGDTYYLPQKAKILACSDIYPQAFTIGTLVGIQFHLEVTEKMIQSWLRTYKSEVVSEKIDAQKIQKESAVHIKELEKYCSTVYSNFCNNFSL
jgi:GMP synthase (glutamine-hydrolysing)